MYFTGEAITAAEAYRLGAVEKLVKNKDELREAALTIARKIAAKSPAMIAIAKESLNGVEDGDLEDKYRWEQGFTLQAYLHPESAGLSWKSATRSSEGQTSLTYRRHPRAGGDPGTCGFPYPKGISFGAPAQE
jgi:1,4-dihydroxy-2-naphthoyl-CoA synthase